MFWWITVIGGIAVVILVWATTTVPVDMLMAIVSQGENMDARPMEVLDNVSRYWNYGPRILIIGLLVFGVMKLLQKEGEQQRY